MTEVCPYCGSPSCSTREACSEYLRKLRAQDAAGLAYFTAGLPIRLGNDAAEKPSETRKQRASTD